MVSLVAHRGNAHDFPENTLAAFESALNLGLKFLELDVQLSADGVPIVIHDASLERTAGVVGSVFEMRAREIRQIEVPETVRFGERYRGTRIPLLRDVLKLIQSRPESRCSSRSSARAWCALATIRSSAAYWTS